MPGGKRKKRPALTLDVELNSDVPSDENLSAKGHKLFFDVCADGGEQDGFDGGEQDGFGKERLSARGKKLFFDGSDTEASTLASPALRSALSHSDLRGLKDEGDQDLYTTQNLARREALKVHPKMREVIAKFWNVIDMAKDDEGCIRQEVYRELNIRLHKALIPDIEAKEADAEALADWVRDSHNSDKMGYERFFLAMFELADVWCLDIDVSRLLVQSAYTVVYTMFDLL
jgi:hypothetical protein